MKKSIIAIAIAILTLTTVSSAYAAGNIGYGQSNCQVIYGGGQVCANNIQFILDKKVMSPTKGGDFVDNLSINDSKFQANNDVTFRITIRNTGDRRIDRLDVVDTLPQNVTFVSGPGNFNRTNNTISYTINNLEVGATNEQAFVARIADTSALPKDQSTLCLTNSAKATDNQGNQATDSSSFCIERQIVNPTPTPQVFSKVPVENIPKTGPEMLSLIGLIPAGLAGFALRRKSKLD